MTQSAIRPVVQQDLPSLKTIIDQTELFPSSYLDDMIAGYFAGDKEAGHWLSYAASEPLGLVYYSPEPMTQGTFNALLLAVHPEHHSKGIGAALMSHVEHLLREQGERVLLVETSSLSAFARTRKFYRRIGYEEEARIREFYAKGEDKIVFRKAL